MSITRPLGFRAAAATAGIKPSGNPDLALIVCDGDAARRSAAAVFTQNAVVGAPVEIGREWRAAYAGGGERGSALRAVLVNAGCSNAATGQPGVEDARKTMRAVASAVGCGESEVLPSSTGIIGHRLPVSRILAEIPGLARALARGDSADEGAARAIMTTDLVPKMAHREVEIGGHTVHLGAIAKGSGMIAPRLDSLGVVGAGAAAAGVSGAAGVGAHATMLAFITTDAAIDGPSLQVALEAASRESFDRVSVDGHPSCSDTAAILASGQAAMKPITRSDPAFHGFRRALTSLCQELATMIARDGEGATRTFRVEVRGAATNADAEKMARAVVDSPLVKCAIHGKDPNWGRIVTAAGNAGIRFDAAEAGLSIGGVEVYRAGVPTGVTKTDHRLVASMNADPVECLLVVGHGAGHAWMLGCDLSAEYVRINAEYTT